MAFYQNKIFTPSLNGVFSIDILSGKVLSRFGTEPTQIPPVFEKNQIYIANNGSIESYDLESNKKNWRFNLTKDGVNARIWSGFSYDKKTNLLFAVTSDTGFTYDSDIKDGGYSNSVLAINAKTGQLVWQFQEIKHDLWDLDIVGQPIIADIKIGGKLIPSVLAVSKSGNVLHLNRLSGKPIHETKIIALPKYDDESKFASREQLLFEKPTPFSKNSFDLIHDISNLTPEKKKYIEFKLRHAVSRPFLPVTTKYDVVYFGIHGGAEWPGATLDPKRSLLVVPSNSYPWILRARHFAKDEEKIKSLSRKNLTYISKCASCHGNNLRGAYLKESDGDLYFPSLVRISNYADKEKLLSLDEFKSNHRYISNISKNNLNLIFEKVSNDNEKENFFKKILLHFGILKIFENEKIDYSKINIHEFINSITKKDLNEVYLLFTKIQEEFPDEDDYGVQSFWQLVLDQDGLPGSNPPWGYITAIDLKTGLLKWKKPFGLAHDKNSHKSYPGDMNFGGLMTTAQGIVFANGTRDSYARAYDIENGEELWRAKLPASGSSPPMSYKINGCQFILFNATGGIFFGYKNISDSIVAFKLNNCK